MLVAGIALSCYVYWMGKTFRLVTGTVKQVTKKAPFRLSPPVFQSGTPPPTTSPQKTTEDTLEVPPAEIHPVQMTKNPERCLPGPTNSAQIRKASRQEGTGRLFCVSGTQDESRFGGPPEPTELKTLFQKLTTKAITPLRSTPRSVGYDVFTPINFTLKPQEQKTIFIDLAITPPEGYYTQLMLKSGLAVLYELEIKAGVIDPDYTGNIGVVLKNNSQSLFERVIGEPIAQLLFY